MLDYSGSIPASLIILVHLASWTLTNSPSSCGELENASKPMIGERVLRPALVAVAKGGPKATAEPPANDNSGAPRNPRGFD